MKTVKAKSKFEEVDQLVEDGVSTDTLITISHPNGASYIAVQLDDGTLAVSFGSGILIAPTDAALLNIIDLLFKHGVHYAKQNEHESR